MFWQGFHKDYRAEPPQQSARLGRYKKSRNMTLIKNVLLDVEQFMSKGSWLVLEKLKINSIYMYYNMKSLVVSYGCLILIWIFNSMRTNPYTTERNRLEAKVVLLSREMFTGPSSLLRLIEELASWTFNTKTVMPWLCQVQRKKCTKYMWMHIHSDRIFRKVSLNQEDDFSRVGKNPIHLHWMFCSWTISILNPQHIPKYIYSCSVSVSSWPSL